MLIYLKPGDVYEVNDLLEHPLYIYVVQSYAMTADWPKAGDKVHEADMKMKPRRYLPSNKFSGR